MGEVVHTLAKQSGEDSARDPIWSSPIVVQAEQKTRHFGRLSGYVSWLHHGLHEDMLAGFPTATWAIESLASLFYYGYAHREDRHGLGVRLLLKDRTPNLHVGQVRQTCSWPDNSRTCSASSKAV